jgi:hypothetical protein
MIRFRIHEIRFIGQPSGSLDSVVLEDRTRTVRRGVSRIRSDLKDDLGPNLRMSDVLSKYLKGSAESGTDMRDYGFLRLAYPDGISNSTGSGTRIAGAVTVEHELPDRLLEGLPIGGIVRRRTSDVLRDA